MLVSVRFLVLGTICRSGVSFYIVGQALNRKVCFIGRLLKRHCLGTDDLSQKENDPKVPTFRTTQLPPRQVHDFPNAFANVMFGGY